MVQIVLKLAMEVLRHRLVTMFIYNFPYWVSLNLHAKFELPTLVRSGLKVCGGGANN